MNVSVSQMSNEGRYRPATIPLSGIVTLTCLAIVVIGAIVPITAFAFRSTDATSAFLSAWHDPTLWRALRFTVWQAGLSTILSVAVAIPVALYIHDQGRFAGQSWLLRLFSLPLALPQIVAVLAIVGIYGRNGWLSRWIEPMGWPPLDIYGLSGILLAHVFFNMPLAVRIIVMALQRQPGEYRKLTAILAMPWRHRYIRIHWPAARLATAQAATLVFLLCVTSFTVVLTLGGGPSSTTLEVAIYQALTYDFDLARASAIIMLQLAVTAMAVLFVTRLGTDIDSGTTLSGHAHGEMTRPGTSVLRWLPLALPTLFVALPFANIILDGLAASPVAALTKPTTLSALGTSLTIASVAALLATLAAWTLGQTISRMQQSTGTRGRPGHWIRLLEAAPSLVLVIPPLLLAAGWFITIRQFTNPFSAGSVMVVIINAVMALPFAARLLIPAIVTHNARSNRLCHQLGLQGVARLVRIDWPTLKHPFAAALAFSAALSLGDVSVVALYGSNDLVTLPSLILAKMGSYRSDEAEALALILCALTTLIMVVADKASAASREAR